MLDLFFIYKWTILASVLAAPILSLLGVQLATRDRALQTLCVGQGAMLGVLLGLGGYVALEGTALLGDFLRDLEGTGVEEAVPFFTAFLVGAATFLTANILVRNKAASKNTFFAFLLSVLMAGSYLMSSLFPALENHMSQIYFGDLATLTEFHAFTIIAASTLAMGILFQFGRAMTNASFELAVFGSRPAVKSRVSIDWFQIYSLLILCCSVQYMGFLFTIAMLFLPTAVLKFMHSSSLHTHLVMCATTSSVGTLIGFLLSLQYTRLPTVSTIAVVTLLICFGVLGIEHIKQLLNKEGGVLAKEGLSEAMPQPLGGRG